MSLPDAALPLTLDAGQASFGDWWNNLSPRTRKLIIAVAVAETGLKAAVLIDLRRRPAAEIRGPKRAWAAAMLANSAGLLPLSYFAFGRRRSRAD
jgi:hypothetical protein